MDLIEKILTSEYSKLFSNNAAKIDKEFKEYAKKVHPDVNNSPQAAEAFQQLVKLRDAALKAIELGIWERKNYIQFKTKAGKTLEIAYQYHRVLDVCDMYVCRKRVIYVFNRDKEKYYKNFIISVRNLKYKDPSMEKNYSMLFPKDLALHETDEKLIVTFPKESDVYPFGALIKNYWKNKVPGKHLAWITSRLMSILAYTSFTGIVINGIDLDSLFVSPSGHAIFLYGGWWFATRQNEKMLGTTSAIYSIMPPKVRADLTSDYITDIESVKYMLRALSDDCPDAIKNFYLTGSGDDHFEEWKKWDEALKKGYGERKFVKIEPTEKEIYLER